MSGVIASGTDFNAPVFSATIFFTNGNQRYEFGSPEVIIKWAARYGVALVLSSAGWKCVKHGDNIEQVLIER